MCVYDLFKHYKVRSIPMVVNLPLTLSMNGTKVASSCDSLYTFLTTLSSLVLLFCISQKCLNLQFYTHSKAI